MDHQPPPFFKRGPSPLVRLIFFAFLSLAFVGVDARYHYLGVFRQAIVVLVYPLQQAATAPLTMVERISGFFVTQAQLASKNLLLEQQQLQQAAQLQRYQALQSENAHLRKLLGARDGLSQTSVMAEILYAGRDPLSRKIIVNKGSRHQIGPGQVVVDNLGVIGQVTRVYPFTSEVTLITDKDQAVPVEVVRNGLRAIAFGHGQDEMLELPFMASNADIQNGDVLVTSGIDGTYPAGLPVAVVSNIERNTAYAFSKISCTPSAGVAHNKQLLILSGLPQPFEAGAPAKPRPGKQERGTR